MTGPLFRDDPYRREAAGTVVAHTPEGGIVLDASLFYPTGGGQPGDSGRVSWPGGALEIATAVKGHGDEIVIADANFPGTTNAKRLVRLDGITATDVLDAVLTLMPLDDFVDQAAFTMQVVSDPTSVPEVVQEFNATLQRHGCAVSQPLERFAFYQRAAAAFAIVATGERRVFGNILLKKGVVRS